MGCRMLHTLDMEKNYQKYLKTAILVGVLFKLLLMGLFSSDYQDEMFIPFVDLFLCRYIVFSETM